LDSPDKEPWSFGYRYETINKRSIELRYELLPYIYNAMEQASETGLPALRPLFLDFPDDENITGMDDEFLFGDDLLVAPILYEGVVEREVYLPKGDWFDYWTGRQFTGGQTIHLPVTIDSIPMFVRGGGFIFRQPVIQSTDQMPGNSLRVLIAPAHESESSLYEDNGKTLDYRQGDLMKRRFKQASDDHLTTIQISAPEGTYRPAKRDLVLQTWSDWEPKGISLQIGTAETSRISLPHLEAPALAKSPRGWTFADGLLTVKVNDHFESMHFTIAR
jgi:alpha-glucosidase